ncbi:MAG: orotidine-5'-phosphate decarboxylase [Candidatus Paceibacterota bacterium]
MHTLDVVPAQHWLYSEEQADVVRKLVEFGLIKFSAAHNLPLKSGGTTDIYINLREARNDPGAIRYLARLFSTPIERLGVHRFVEVPDAVSCLAGLLASETGLPYLTVRKEAKEGRATDARVIGTLKDHEKVVAILDDVMTDGGSKVAPYAACVALDLFVKALVVLVDRQRDWPGTFRKNGMDLPVWSGMTLHDVRKHLIRTLGLMQRCDPAMEEQNPIILALDGRKWPEWFPFLEFVRPTGCILKANDMLFNEGMKHLLPELVVYGRIMADIKSLDIPPTVANIFKHLEPHEVWGVTVHASGHEEMVRQAVEAVKGTITKVLAVTVLTSFDEKACEEVYHRRPLDQVLELAEIAHRAGAHGFVCSPQEVGVLKEKYPAKTFVIPGTRSPGADTGAQKRITTPREAWDAGADHLVMGSQVTKKEDPLAEVQRVMREELGLVC